MSIVNNGSDAGPFRGGFYFSSDSQITTTDKFSGWSCAWSGGLAANSTSGCGGNITIPADLPAGNSYFGAIVDDRNQVAEFDETNNSRAAAPPMNVTVSQSPGPFTLSGTPQCNGTAPEIRLTWTDAAAAEYYDLYRNGSCRGSHLDTDAVRQHN